MKALFPVLLMYSLTFTAQGRIMSPLPTYQEMFDQADLVTIALPVSTNDTPERMNLPNVSPDIPVIGIETEFVVQTVLKGDKAMKKFVLHHYRQTVPKRYGNGPPGLVSFDPTNRKSVLLFLKKEPDGRYAPINGQTDPDMAGILPADRIDLIAIAKPLSTKEETEQADQITHLTGYQTKFGVQEVLMGDKATKNFVLHHYERPFPHGSIDFNPQPDQLYLLFLRKDADGRYAPVTRPGEFGAETIAQGFSVVRLDNALH